MNTTLFEILLSKIEYKKKKSIKNGEEKYQNILLSINKIVNKNYNFTKEEKDSLLKALEYSFKKKLLSFDKSKFKKKEKYNKTEIALFNYSFLVN